MTSTGNEAQQALSAIASRSKKDINLGGLHPQSKEASEKLASELNRIVSGEWQTAQQTVEFLDSNGFVTQMARDVFQLHGNKDLAERADAMVQLLGDNLYELLKTRASNCGFDNECDWLAQQLWVGFEREEFSTKGAMDPRTKEDDTPRTVYNDMIERMLGKRVLGRIVQYAKACEPPISNSECLRWGTFNYLRLLIGRGI